MQNEISYGHDNDESGSPRPSLNETGSKSTNKTGSRSARKRGSKVQQRASSKATQQASPQPQNTEAKLTSEPALALFSLIADPKTIAGETSPSNSPPAPDANEEVDRLRQALQAREREIDALRRETQSRELLNAAQAHRLANEARQSELASRGALHAAQKAHHTDVEANKLTADQTPHHAQNEKQNPLPGAASKEQSWQTRPLSAQRHTLDSPSESKNHGPLPPRPSPESETPEKNRSTQDRVRPLPSQSELLLRAAKAEVRELEATLSIARDTSLNQKLEIARLRTAISEQPDPVEVEFAALEKVFRAALPEDEPLDIEAIQIAAKSEIQTEFAQEREAAKREIQRLRERVTLNERETETREDERRLLRDTLAEREEELHTTHHKLKQSTLRLQQEADLVQELRSSLDQERERSAKTQSLLAQLHSTLQQAPQQIGIPDPAVEVGRLISSRQPSRAEDPDQLPPRATFITTPAHKEAPTELGLLGQPPAPVESPQPDRLFDAWQDDQVRRHFGPFGIDTSRDLVMAPLTRRNPTLKHPGKILVLGRGAEEWTEQLAEDLIASENPPFQILRGDGGSVTRRGDMHERPIDEFITTTRAPQSPADLEALLSETRPSVIVSRNFLSGVSEVGPWLEVLKQRPRMGPGLVLLESTGVGPVKPSETMSELGGRIWSLMPSRYTLNHAHRSERVPTWQDAFAQMKPLSENGLRDALRENFILEISASFGFLIEPFLRSPIAINFDPNAARDRRFLNQIADLDDRKIEAGFAPALHFVARIDDQSQ